MLCASLDTITCGNFFATGRRRGKKWRPPTTACHNDRHPMGPKKANFCLTFKHPTCEALILSGRLFLNCASHLNVKKVPEKYSVK